MQTNGYDEADPLNGMPPQPGLRSAAPNALRMPRPSMASAVALTGSGQIQQTMQKMMQLEKLMADIVKDFPTLSNLGDQFVTQMRDMGAAAMADKVQGGPGSAADSGTPAPTAGAGSSTASPAGPPPLPPM